jgi:hypothetical protein
MGLVMLIICAMVTWATAHVINSLTHLGQLLIPSPWLVGGIALVVITWIMRD